MSMQVGASSSSAAQAAWQTQKQNDVSQQAAPAVAASQQADAQIATASVAMATGSTMSIMV